MIVQTKAPRTTFLGVPQNRFQHGLEEYVFAGLIAEAIRRLVKTISYQIPKRTVRSGNHLWDFVHGTDTARFVLPTEEHFKACQSSPSGTLRRAVQSMQI